MNTKILSSFCILTAIDFVVAVRQYQLQLITSIEEGSFETGSSNNAWMVDETLDDVKNAQTTFSSLEKSEKVQLCAEALKLDYCRNHNFRLLPHHRPSSGKTYWVRLYVQNQGKFKKKIFVRAFKCPTNPPIYLRILTEWQPIRVMVIKDERPSLMLDFSDEILTIRSHLSNLRHKNTSNS